MCLRWPNSLIKLTGAESVCTSATLVLRVLFLRLTCARGGGCPIARKQDKREDKAERRPGPSAETKPQIGCFPRHFGEVRLVGSR